MAAIDEADIGQVKQGQKATFTVDAFQGESFNGAVQEVRLNPTTTSNVVTYTVVITAENPEQKLLPGMTATCTIVTQEVKDAIAIPVKALKFTPADGTPMADPKDMPRPPRMDRDSLAGDSAFAKGDFPPPPPGGFGPPGSGTGGSGKFGPPGKGVFKKRAGAKKPAGDHVWVSIDGKAAPRRVKTGISDGVNIQILRGLSVGDSVVVSQESVGAASTEKAKASNPFMPTPPGRKKK